MWIVDVSSTMGSKTAVAISSYLRVTFGILYELRHTRIVGELPSSQVSEPKNASHLRVIDLVGGIGRVVIIRMETCKPPESWNIVQHERKLVTPEEDIQR